ncbi:AAA family ATPase [Corynebacterium sp. HMSC077G01]|uniref:AAA family ATPase n=1 Tax=Corynebacterium sp. HMSC077G01 TaxID=1715193 RepID=UPI001439DE2E|nr:AAA family ATPase [Corynebacterium sp. HMSC077G01]
MSAIEHWNSGHNLLLYGPPGTGKTRFLSELYRAVNTETNQNVQLTADPENTDLPLAFGATENFALPGLTKTYWCTFHQSFGYEDFVLGYRPANDGGGIELTAHAGILLDAVLELADPDSLVESAVLFIDEINRANASRVFGEFITFLDFDYREGGAVPIPMPLRQLAFQDGFSEEIIRLNGEKARIPLGFKFPRNIFVVGTMNSVDRSAIPLDSALSRRFRKIELIPNRQVLEGLWQVKYPGSINVGDSYNAYQIALVLFEYLNYHISNDYGSEFELGHGLFMGLKGEVSEAESDSAASDAAWRQLAEIWDDILFPQVEERYAGRPVALLKLLRVDEFSGVHYAWKVRDSSWKADEQRSLSRCRLSDCETDLIMNSFIRLVSSE